MDHLLTVEQKTIKSLVKHIVQSAIPNYGIEYDEQARFPVEVMEAFKQSGLFKIHLSAEYGGVGEDLLSLCLAAEEIARVDGSTATIFLASHLGVTPIKKFGSQQQKDKYLPLFSNGSLFAFGLTEAHAGSDISKIRTSAVPEGDHYVLSGSKTFITNGGEADYYVIYAHVDKGHSSKRLAAFIVEKGLEGFTFGKKENKLGIRNSPTRELIFDRCIVPAANVLGNQEQIGFRAAIKTFEETRVVVAAQAVGMAQGALDYAVKFAKEREQFNQKITSFQGIQWMISDMSTKIEAARALTYAAARAYDQGKDFNGAISAQAKIFASDVAVEVTNTAVQLMGGYGYMKEYPVEKFLRDAKITQIYEGTNQVLKNIVSMQVLKDTDS